jgi:hypothetical protein
MSNITFLNSKITKNSLLMGKNIQVTFLTPPPPVLIEWPKLNSPIMLFSMLTERYKGNVCKEMWFKFLNEKNYPFGLLLNL